MGFIKAELERKNVHTLRQIGREKGVKAPSLLKKSELIEQILGIERGEIPPRFPTGGRPALDTELKIEKKTKKNDSKKAEQVKKLISEYTAKLIKILEEK